MRSKIAVLAALGMTLGLLGCRDVEVTQEVIGPKGGPGTATSSVVINVPGTIQLPCPVGTAFTQPLTAQAVGMSNASFSWSATAGQVSGTNWVISQPGTHQLIVTATSGATVRSDTATVVVIACQAPPQQAPIVNFTVTPQVITLGQSVNAVWSTQFAQTCNASGNWSGTKALSGSETITPTSAGVHTFTLTCTGPGGSTTIHQNVTVNPASANLVISPQNPTITLSSVGGVCVAQIQLSAFFNNQNVTSSVAWSTTGGPTVVGGLFRATVAGTYTVTATYQGASTSTTVTVTGSCPPASQFQLDRTSASMTACPSSSLVFTATSGTVASVQVTGGGNLANVAVDQVGNRVVVTAVGSGAVGTVTFNVTGTNGTVVPVTVQMTSCPQQEQACTATTLDYTPAGGTISGTGSRQINSIRPSNFGPNCNIIWFTERRDILRVNGDIVLAIDGSVFYAAGLNAVATCVAPGTTTLTGWIVSRNPSTGVWTRIQGASRTYTWTCT